MDNERRYKALSKMLIALGIMMSIGGLIGLIGGFANMWNLHELDAKDWLFGAIVGGFNIWILGVLIGRKHRWDKKTAKDILSLKILVAVFLIGHLVTSFGRDVTLFGSLSLNKQFIYMLCGCLGVGIASLNRTRKEQSAD